MSQIVSKKFFIVAILLVALVAVYVEAQRYGGYGGRGYGYGGGRGYGGRGYYGGGYGGGRGYGGGYGRGGYGGGYGRGYRGYGNDYGSVYPSYGAGQGSYGCGGGSGGGYGSSGCGYGGGGYASYGSYGASSQYDNLEDDDYYSSYSDSHVTAASPSGSGSEVAASTPNQAVIPSVVSGARTSRRQRPTTAATLGSNDQPGWSSPQDAGFEAPPPEWYLSQQGADPQQQQPQLAGSSSFDLITSNGDQWAGSSVERASERNTLASRTAGQLSSSSDNGINNRPSVPTSTTTPAPDFVMINPTTSGSS